MPNPSLRMYVRLTHLPPIPIVRSAASQMMNNKLCTIKFGHDMTNISWFDYLKMYPHHWRNTLLGLSGMGLTVHTGWHSWRYGYLCEYHHNVSAASSEENASCDANTTPC
jgi:hypothetical protein